jgi:single-stranded-DNA-specific exonuclease
MTNSFRQRPWRADVLEGEIPQSIPNTLPGLVRRLLAARMSRYGETAENWLQPTMRNTFPDLFAPRDMRQAAQVLFEAIKAGKTIGLFGDYDADGATSVGVMGRYLTDLGITWHLHIPDRFTEGYGPNVPAIQALVEKGCELIVILDSGSTAFEVMDQVAELGIEAVIVDHHACAEGRHPKALAFVNPNRHDDTSGLGYLCAAGLSFLTCCAVHKFIRLDPDWARPKPDLMAYLDIAALGTVADVVPLRGFNRTLVSCGLTVMHQRPNMGIKALMQVSGIDGRPNASDLGFRLGPRVNAGGRIGDAQIGAKLMTQLDHDDAAALAAQLDTLNTERKAIEEDVRSDASAKAEAIPTSRNLILVSGKYHEGVVGITAGRLKEAYLKPTIVLSETEHGTLKGSGRSMPGFDLGHAVIAAREAGLLIAGGGHGMAAGLTVAPEKVEALVKFIEDEIAQSDFARTGAILPYDLEANENDLSVETIEALHVLEPFGEGNPRPRLLISGLTVETVDVLKDVHLRVNFSLGRQRFKAMLFSSVGQPFAQAIEAAKGQKVDVVASVKINEWNGRKSLELELLDARPAVAASAFAA